MRGILLDIRSAGAAVKDVIRREVNEARVNLATDHGDVADRQRIHFVSGARLFLGDIHLVVSHGIEDHWRV